MKTNMPCCEMLRVRAGYRGDRPSFSAVNKHGWLVLIISYDIHDSCAAQYLGGILWWMESSKEQHLFEMEIFCYTINVTLIPLRSAYEYKRFLTEPKVLNGGVSRFPLILSSTTVFNIDDNQKYFLSSILLWFLKSSQVKSPLFI